MYEKIIESYVHSLSKEDIQKFAMSKDIFLTEEETEVLFVYAKNHWRTFYKGDPTILLGELEKKLKPQTFEKLKQIYIETKNKFSF